jgi:hypothetical protein
MELRQSLVESDVYNSFGGSIDGENIPPQSDESDENFGDFNPNLKTRLLYSDRDSLLRDTA